MVYNLDDVFIHAKINKHLDETYNAIINAKCIDDIENIPYMDDVIVYDTLDDIKKTAKQFYNEYKD